MTPLRPLFVVVLLAACPAEAPTAVARGDAGEQAAPDAGDPEDAAEGPDAAAMPDASTRADLDQDGLDDARELELAETYLPFLAIDPADACSRGGIVFRARPHPKDPSLVLVVYDHLYEKDCGLNGHVGDDETFGATIDPSKPPPQGLTALRAISHQGTFCEVQTECGRCAPLVACETGAKDGAAFPVVYASKDKHGSYVSEARCDAALCLDSCSLSVGSAAVPLVNAGEPGAPLVTNLSTQGFITAANGWTEPSLFAFDPWDAAKTFGKAGNVAGDLTDPAFETPPCK